MTFAWLPFAAGASSLALAFVALLRKPASRATWCFSLSMALMGIHALLMGQASRATGGGPTLAWLQWSFVVGSLTPSAWLLFSLVYSRGDARALVSRWRWGLLLAAALPLAVAMLAGEGLLRLVVIDGGADLWVIRLGSMAKAHSALLLVVLTLTLMHLEQTFRATVGTVRWRIKYVVIAIAVVLGTQVYVRSQTMLFTVYDEGWIAVQSSALLVTCVMLILAHARAGMAEVDVYPSTAAVRSSITIVLVGGYLFVVGLLAQVVGRFGWAEAFEVQALVVLLGMVGLALLLLSDRMRRRIRHAVSRHLARPRHDATGIWTRLSTELAEVRAPGALCAQAARLVSESFAVLSVTVWILDEIGDGLILGGSTAGATTASSSAHALDRAASQSVLAGIENRSQPFDLDAETQAWAATLREATAQTFGHGGSRWCVPLRHGGRSVGAMILSDRVDGAVYTAEELDLLRCIADHVTSALLNLRLSEQVARSRELQAFQTMSAFFVHDLKNAASSLNLTIKNLPLHGDDPEFRADAFKAVGNAARRIDELMGRLSALRQHRELQLEPADLSALVREASDSVTLPAGVEFDLDLHPELPILADRHQMKSVVSNLILNAADAVDGTGRIHVRTEMRQGRAAVVVSDTGCGMSPEFVRDSLFRPFTSTKRHGLGIGLFQSRTLVQAHGGTMHVESTPGRGTSFEVHLPMRNAA